jgi:hypothetical protein
MRHAFVCVLLAAAALAVDGHSAAQAASWCASYKGGAGTSCGFATFEQCLASVSGVGGTCNQNPLELGRPAPGGAPGRARIRDREEQRSRAKEEQRAKAAREEQRAKAKEEEKAKQAEPKKEPAKPATTETKPATPPVAATPVPAATNTARKPAPKDARVYFVGLQDGAEVSSPITMLFGVAGMGVAPAGIDNPNTGHHHLLIDAKLPNLDLPIPSDFNHLHFGAGQTEATVSLQPGKHTLQLLFADTDHLPHNPPVMSAPITITVKAAK